MSAHYRPSHAQQQQGQPMPPPSSTAPRRPPTMASSRGPPILPPGMPVKAEAASKQTINQHQQHARQHIAPPGQQQQQQRMSMPPPRTTAALHKTAPRMHAPPPHHHHQQQQSGYPFRQADHDSTLRESTRFNSTAGSSRSGSSTDTWLQTPEHQSKAMMQDVDVQFDQLLDNLQVASSVRQKFKTVSMDVKSSILTSSVNSNPAILNHLGLPVPQQGQQSPRIRKRLSAPLLRKVKSSSSIGGGQQDVGVGKTCNVNGDEFVIVASPMSPPLPPPSRGQSMDMPRLNPGPSPKQRPTNGPRPISGMFSSTSASSAKSLGLGIAMGEQPDSFIAWLRTYKGTDVRMEVDRMKKLRMLLRHESTAWVQAFLEMGGYELVLARLQDLFDVEWREEQHDDQMLHELLRCVKALTTTEIGKTAIRQHYPKPFDNLSSLLFSEKKPGDLATRQLMVELWLFLFDLYPSTPSATRSPHSHHQRQSSTVRFDTPPPPAPAPTIRATDEVHRLLSPALPNPYADQHTFITNTHRTRIFKALMGELSDICRDYFWIMCHGSNHLWQLSEVDLHTVEKPVAPGGATGGVEFEAMHYVTMHYKLLNALCRTMYSEDREKAAQLHRDLNASGMLNLLSTFRKASAVYYPFMHLELARYVALLQEAVPASQIPLPISKLLQPPPDNYRRFSDASFGFGQ